MAGRFDYVKYDAQTAAKQEECKQFVEQLETWADLNLADGRAKALFLTKLEETYMWAGKALRDEQVQRGSQVEHVPERKPAPPSTKR